MLGAAVAWFFYAWRAGHLLKLSGYVAETREELRKCTWPTWAELKGSTVIVFISLGVLATFTVVVDVVITALVRLF